MANQKAVSDNNSVKGLLVESTSVAGESVSVKGNPGSGALLVQLDTTSTASSGLGKAEDAPHASGDVGIETLGVRNLANPTAQTSAQGDYGAFAIDALGNQIVTPYASPDYDWQTNPITLTAAATPSVLKAAGAAGIKNYITDLDIANTSATGVRVDILDGATIIRSFWSAPTSHIFKTFNKPIKGTAATALNVQISAATTDVRVSGNGFIAL